MLLERNAFQSKRNTICCQRSQLDMPSPSFCAACRPPIYLSPLVKIAMVLPCDKGIKHNQNTHATLQTSPETPRTAFILSSVFPNTSSGPRSQHCSLSAREWANLSNVALLLQTRSKLKEIILARDPTGQAHITHVKVFLIGTVHSCTRSPAQNGVKGSLTWYSLTSISHWKSLCETVSIKEKRSRALAERLVKSNMWAISSSNQADGSSLL